MVSLLAPGLAAGASLRSPVSIADASGPAFPMGRANGNPPDPTYAAEKAIDGNPDTFCCLLDDTLTGASDKTIPSNAGPPVTGHIVLDLGHEFLVKGLRLTSRKSGALNPRETVLLAGPELPALITAAADRKPNPPDAGSTRLAMHSFRRLHNGTHEDLFWQSIVTRYVALRVHSSYETGRVHNNFQIAEIAFHVLPVPDGLAVGAPGPDVHVRPFPTGLRLPEPPVKQVRVDDAQRMIEAEWRLQRGTTPIATAITQERARIQRILDRQATALPADALRSRRAEFAALSGRADAADLPAPDALYLALRRFKRRLLLGDSQIDFQRMVCIDVGYSSDRHQTLHRNAAQSPVGGRLLVLDGLGPDAGVKKLAPQNGTPSGFWRPDVSYDGEKILFCMKPRPDGTFHLYELNVDGTGLRQITRGTYDDLDPVYAPDGGIVFSTTRCNQLLPCGDSRYRMFILARCNAAGKEIYFLSANHECDYLPAFLPDGRLLFTRWEYYDKSVSRVQSLWTCNPDGTGISAVWGNQSKWPDILWNARQIPGTNRILFNSGGHHDAFSGSLGVVDRNEGMNYPDGLYAMTPRVPWVEVGRGPEDHVLNPNFQPPTCYVGYQSPFPIGKDLFLVSARTGASPNIRAETDLRGHRLYLMDYDGNMELLYAGTYNTLYAQPIRPRPRPPALASTVRWPGKMTRADHEPAPGVLYSADVYEGTTIPRGMVKALRVLDADCRHFSNCRGGGHTPNLGNAYRKKGAFPGCDIVGETPVSFVYADAPKRILGTVPVAEDGSVSVKVPPLRALYFQLLDERGRCLQTMRSMVHIMPGERRGCVGCHETRSVTPPLGTGVATRRPPQDLTPPPWRDATVSFPRFVQPILDKHCIRCHGGDKPKGDLDLTHRAEDPRDFSWPYVRLLFGKNPKTFNDVKKTTVAGPIFTAAPYANPDVRYPTRETVVPPMTAMSYRSTLIHIATSGKHHDVKVSPEEEQRLIAWVDALCPYNGLEELIVRPDPDPKRNAQFSYPARMRTAPWVHKAFCQDGFDSQDDRLPRNEQGEIVPSIVVTEGKRLYRIPAPGNARAEAEKPAVDILFDFESDGAGGWQVVEGDLGRFRCDRPVWYNGDAFGKQGDGFLSTIETPEGPWNDGLTGVAESPVFVPAAPDMSFLIGGGKKDDVFLELRALDGRVMQRETGHNSHVMRRVEWHVPEAVGQAVVLRVVDGNRGGYGWLILDGFQATGRLDAEATAKRVVTAVRRERRRRLEPLLSQIDLASVEKALAVPDWLTQASTGTAQTFRQRLAAAKSALTAARNLDLRTVTDEELAETVTRLGKMIAFQREAALAHPLVRRQPILFVTRHQYARGHHNTATLHHTGEPNVGAYRPGGALKLLDPRSGEATVLVDPGPEGVVRDPDVHFDGRRILFSMRTARDENYSIYEIEVAPERGQAVVPGSLRRLTNEPEASDIDPCYLPSGKIVFSSTREPKYCHCNMHIMANLYRMDGDGANIHQIGKSTLFEGHASLLPDGRIMYYRWEYVDRNFGDAQGLWTVNPDGTNHAIYWGNNTVSPPAVFDGRAIPGTDLAVCIFGSCHDRPWGALAIIDRSKGIDSPDAVEQIWPAAARKRISIDGSDLHNPFSCDHLIPLRCRYEDPFPLVDPATGRGGEAFLVSRSITDVPESMPVRRSNDVDHLTMGLFLVDRRGVEMLIHSEAPGCFDPMPLAPRPRPRKTPDRRDFTSKTGTMLVSDVYQGTHMQGVKRGGVAALRVVESTEKRVWTGPLWRCAQFAKQHQGRLMRGNTLNRPAVSWAGFETKRILGTVPVMADGSAFFRVPAERFVYFQLLDQDGMLIATMRSGTQVQPREAVGCVGCHEDRLQAPPPKKNVLAAQRPPAELTGWHGPPRTFSYMQEVQPIWDKHCVKCHDFGKKAGEKLILAGDKELVFNASYVELFQNWGKEKALLNTVGLGLAPLNAPRSVGSHRSRLVQLLRKGHAEVKLSPEEMDRVVTWIDLGGPYYPDYACAHPDNVAGRAPISIPQAKRLGELTGIRLVEDDGNPRYWQHRLQISFDRPELSPCLRKLDPQSAAYKEALSIIRAGQQELSKNPEADMPGFTACSEHRSREEKYQRLLGRERRRRTAIARGEKVYDAGLATDQ